MLNPDQLHVFHKVPQLPRFELPQSGATLVVFIQEEQPPSPPVLIHIREHIDVIGTILQAFRSSISTAWLYEFLAADD